MATEYTSVKMTDGRVVDFPGKRKMIKESFVSPTGEISVRIDFLNGETRTYVLNPELKNKFAAHGGEQKYGDETAGIEQVDDMVVACDDLHARLSKGEWALRREGGGFAGISVLMRALVEYTGQPIETIRSALAEMPQATKLALRADPELKPIIARLEAEKVTKGPKIDTTAVLSTLKAA